MTEQEDPPGGVTTLVYKYGCPSWADLGDAGMEQLRLATRLWNKLVETERAHQQQVAAVWAAHPDAGAAAQAAAEAEGRVAAIRAEMKKRRQEDRSTRPRGGDGDLLAQARRDLRQAKAALKAAKTAAMQCAACAAWQDHLNAERKAAGLKGKPKWSPPEDCTCEAERKARPRLAAAKGACRACTVRRTSAAGSLYKEFTGAGLGWATFNDVAARFAAALARIGAERQGGAPADLKFRRFDGSGTLTVQVQRQAADPVPAPAVLASGEGKWRNVVHLSPWADPAGGGRLRGKERHGLLRLRVSGDCRLELPVVIHRMMPAGAEVKEVKVTRQRTGPDHRITVAVCCRVPVPPPARGGIVVSVVPWWSRTPDGTLRAASLSASGPLPPVPAELASFVCPTGPGTAEVRIPAAMERQMGRPAGIQSARSRLLWDKIAARQGVPSVRDSVTSALDADPVFAAALAAAVMPPRPGRAQVTGAQFRAVIARTRSERLMARLLRNWQEMLGDGRGAPPLPPVAGDLLYPPRLQAGKDGRPKARQCACPPGGHDLECWRRRDRHLWSYQAHLRDQVIASRQDAYRKIAAWLCSGAGKVTIRPVALAALRQVPDLDRADEVPGAEAGGKDTAQAVRSNAMDVAPGEFLAAVRSAAARRGVMVSAPPVVERDSRPGRPGEETGT